MTPSFVDSNGRSVTLGPMLGKPGGEGAVYSIRATRNAAKVYSNQTPSDLREKCEKVSAMLTSPPNDPTAGQNHVSIAWPRALLFDGTVFVGFVMPAVHPIGTLDEISNPTIRRAKNWDAFNAKYLHRAAHNLCSAIAAIHDAGHIVGDLNPRNVLVEHRSLVTLIDTDSYVIVGRDGRVFSSKVGVPGYLAPERSLSGGDITKEQDYFTLAILIFELIMGGFHPYAGAAVGGAQSTAELTTCGYLNQGLFPFVPNPEAAAPDGAPLLDLMYPDARDKFVRTFSSAWASPSQRPTPRQWVACLRKAEADLVECGHDPTHHYYASVGSCLWCDRDRRVSRRTGTPLQSPLPAIVLATAGAPATLKTGAARPGAQRPRGAASLPTAAAPAPFIKGPGTATQPSATPGASQRLTPGRIGGLVFAAILLIGLLFALMRTISDDAARQANVPVVEQSGGVPPADTNVRTNTEETPRTREANSERSDVASRDKTESASVLTRAPGTRYLNLRCGENPQRRPVAGFKKFVALEDIYVRTGYGPCVLDVDGEARSVAHVSVAVSRVAGWLRKGTEVWVPANMNPSDIAAGVFQGVWQAGVGSDLVFMQNPRLAEMNEPSPAAPFAANERAQEMASPPVATESVTTREQTTTMTEPAKPELPLMYRPPRRRRGG